MSDFRLVVPSKEYESQAFEYIQEFLEYNSEINGTGGLDRYDNYDEWLLKLERALDIPNIPEGKVPANTYFFVRTLENRIIGMINIRHKLNEFLLNEAGHIGYSIRPTERRKGYGTLMLKLGLEKCKELNINKILITCDKSNAASAKVIQNNNGVLENEVFSETFSEIIQRYWIRLSNTIYQEEIVNKASVSFDSYEEMAEHYFKNVDTKPFNAYYERPATISLLPDVKGKKVLEQDGIQSGC